MVGKVTPNDQLSASEIPVLMNASRFKSINELLKEKMDVISGIEPPFITNESMDWGNTLEETILVKSAQRLGLINDENSSNLKTVHEKPYQHKLLPFACSLDRGPLQLQMQMDTTGAEWGAVCVLYRGTTLKIFVYQRDDKLISTITEAILEFQKRLDLYKTNQEVSWYPIRTPAEASAIFDKPEKTEIEIPEVEEYAQKIVELRDEIKVNDEQIKLAEIQIMDFMRDNQYAVSGRYKISWPTINYKAQPQKIVPPKEARTIRQSKLRIRDREF